MFWKIYLSLISFLSCITNIVGWTVHGTFEVLHEVTYFRLNPHIPLFQREDTIYHKCHVIGFSNVSPLLDCQMKCLLIRKKALKRNLGYSGYCEFFSYNSAERQCEVNMCEKGTTEKYHSYSRNGWTTFFPAERNFLDNEYNFLGKAESLGDYDLV